MHSSGGFQKYSLTKNTPKSTNIPWSWDTKLFQKYEAATVAKLKKCPKHSFKVSIRPLILSDKILWTTTGIIFLSFNVFYSFKFILGTKCLRIE